MHDGRARYHAGADDCNSGRGGRNYDNAAVSSSRWREAAIEYHKARGKNAGIVSCTPDQLARLHKLMADDVTLEQAWCELNRAAQHGRAAASTVEALLFSLRQRRTKALDEPSTKHRISQLSEEQLHEVATRLQAVNITTPWSAEEVEQLAAAWIAHHAE